MAKKILVCSNAYPPNFVGGAELIAHYHALEMHKRGDHVSVFAGDGSGDTHRYAVRHTIYDGLNVFRIGLHNADFRIDYENFYHRNVELYFARVLDHVRPEVVHFHNLIGLSLGMIYQARERGAKTVLTVHDHWGFCVKNTLLRPDHSVCQNYTQCADCLRYVDNDTGKRMPISLRREFFARALEAIDFLISPSRYLAQTYQRAGVAPEKIRVIGYGMNTGRFARVTRTDDAARRFTFVGYLGEHKGLMVLLDAVGRLDKTSGFQVNIVGTGHLEKKLHALVEARGLGNVVHFTGKISNEEIDGILQRTDALILPSVWPENQPVTILEAMAAGLPVIGSRIGGIPELIEDGVTGYLFKPGDAAELAAKMELFIQNPAKIEPLGRQAQSRLKETFETQAEKIRQLYDEPSPPCRPPSAEPLVVCVGRVFMQPAYRALEEFCAATGASSLPARFLMHEWMTPDDWDQAVLVWATDTSTEFENVMEEILKRGLPLLGPEDNGPLRNICLSYDCGLFYRNAAEALACLRLLLNQPDLRRTLGAAAQRGLAIAG